MISQEKQVLLEKYLRGTLSPDEQRQFDKYKQDPEFLAELDLWQKMQPVFEVHGRKRLKEQLVEKEVKLGKKESTFNFGRQIIWLAIAASVLIIVAAIFFGSTTVTDQELFAEYLTPHPNTVYLITRGSEDQSDLAKAFSAYGLEQFNLANELFAKLPSSDTISFYLAITQLQIGEIAEAHQLLSSVQFPSESSLGQGSDWYQALSTLALGKREETRFLLNELIKNPSHLKYREAVELLEKLNP